MKTYNSLGRQVGGTHYTSRAIQPVQFWAANMWDAFSGSILKYITRWRTKDGIEGLEKALHFAQLRIDLDAAIPYPVLVEVGRGIPMRDYVKANSIGPDEEAILTALEIWVQAGRTPQASTAAKHFMRLLTQYIGHIRLEQSRTA